VWLSIWIVTDSSPHEVMAVAISDITVVGAGSGEIGSECHKLFIDDPLLLAFKLEIQHKNGLGFANLSKQFIAIVKKHATSIFNPV
jgi:hypothetical protein